MWASPMNQRKSACPPLGKTSEIQSSSGEDKMDNEEEVFMFVNNKLDVVDKMLTWVTNRAFDQTGVLQLVLNLD